MASLIYFRFHVDFDLCAERLKLLRTLNPDVPIHGIFGGPATEAAAAAHALGSRLDGLYTNRSPDGNWKSMHEDRTLAEWFRDVGHRVTFDYLYDVQYDLLLTEELSRIYPVIDQSTVALSGVQELDVVRSRWYWTSAARLRPSVERYMRDMETRFGLTQRCVSQGPFPLLCRRFVETMSSLDLPDEMFEDIIAELSMPGLAEALGFTIVDTGLHPPWMPGRPVSPLFHCEKTPTITVEQITDELANPAGRRAFHPVKTFIDCERLLQSRRPPAGGKGTDQRTSAGPLREPLAAS